MESKGIIAARNEKEMRQKWVDTAESIYRDRVRAKEEKKACADVDGKRRRRRGITLRDAYNRKLEKNITEASNPSDDNYADDGSLDEDDDDSNYEDDSEYEDEAGNVGGENMNAYEDDQIDYSMPQPSLEELEAAAMEEMRLENERLQKDKEESERLLKEFERKQRHPKYQVQ